MADPVVEQFVTASTGAGTTAATTLAFTTTASIAVGRVIIIANERGATASTNCGVASIAVSSGAVASWIRGASAVRSNTHDLSIMAAVVTTLIPSGATITVTNTANGTRRAGVLAVFTDTTSATSETNSGTSTGADAGTSVGSNGSSSAEVTTATAVNTTADMLVVAAFSESGSSAPMTISSPLTAIADVNTTVGSGDRGVQLGWKFVRATGTQSGTSTQANSAVWAAAIATYPITAATGAVSAGAALTETVTISTAGVVAATGTSAIAATVTVSTTGTLSGGALLGSAALTETVTISTVGFVARSAGAALTETVTISTTGILPGGTPVKSVIVGGVKKTITSRSVIVGGVKKTITSTSVIIGGVKKPTV